MLLRTFAIIVCLGLLLMSIQTRTIDITIAVVYNKVAI